MNNLKLGVEVLRASGLIAKGNGRSCNAQVELNFDGQRFRTSTKMNDPNPTWNEKFFFNVSDSASLQNLHLEVNVYHVTLGTQDKSFLGKVYLSGTSFVPVSVAAIMSYPLEKRNFFSRVKGELELKVYFINDPSIKPSNPLPAIDPVSQVEPQQPVMKEATKKKSSETKHTFYHLPNQTPAPAPAPAPTPTPAPAPAPAQKDPPLPPPQLNPAIITPSESLKFNAEPMKVDVPKVVNMYSNIPSQSSDFNIKETAPFLGGIHKVGGLTVRDRQSSTYDLVEQMQYLFIRVVKAKDLPPKDITGSLDPYVEVKLGNHKCTTKHFEKNQNPQWNEVFAFSRDILQVSTLEVLVKDKDAGKDDFVGIVKFDMNEVPFRVPPDSPLAPEWYRLVDKKGEKLTKGEVMLSIWTGTQADESFSEAWRSDGGAANNIGAHIRSKVYHSPRLWYVRVNIIEAQELVPSDKNRYPDVSVKVQLANQASKTKTIQAKGLSPLWNEEFMLVTAEPFEDELVLTVEDRVAANKDEVLGKVSINLANIERRLDNRYVDAKWYSLTKPGMDAEQMKKEKFSSRLHLRLSLDGGYHVFDESTHYSSDLRPTAKQLWKPSIGVLELGILGADNLCPMKTRDGKGTCDTYCVAKYGHKWIRTWTIINSLCPRFNEQYTWEVFDVSTVIIIGVFNNAQIGEKDASNKDTRIGKIRIRISTLEANRIYTHKYPLLDIQPQSGLKKMGELHVAIRFSCSSTVNIMSTYARPLLPKMHYVRPLSLMQQELLRHHAVKMVAARLSRAEPPLRQEVVEYMSDVDSHLWSMRKSQANFFRLISVFSGATDAIKWFNAVCTWRNRLTTVLVHVLFVMLVCFPELILPTIFLYMFLIGLWKWRFRPRHPPYMNIKMSRAESVHPDELDEEFDDFPSSRSPELIRMRYDRLRNVAGRMQTVLGDIATQGERLQGILSWRDPRATIIFMVFCLIAAVVLYVTPLQVVVFAAGIYAMRHPRFRSNMPSPPINFFRRLPALTDCLL